MWGNYELFKFIYQVQFHGQVHSILKKMNNVLRRDHLYSLAWGLLYHATLISGNKSPNSTYKYLFFFFFFRLMIHFLFIFFKFYFIFKLYIIVLVLPNIKMNPPQVYKFLKWDLLLRNLNLFPSTYWKEQANQKPIIFILPITKTCYNTCVCF